MGRRLSCFLTEGHWHCSTSCLPGTSNSEGRQLRWITDSAPGWAGAISSSKWKERQGEHELMQRGDRGLGHSVGHYCKGTATSPKRLTISEGSHTLNLNHADQFRCPSNPMGLRVHNTALCLLTGGLRDPRTSRLYWTMITCL